ncbi:carbohydrate kinase family protein [Microbacterium sp. ZW T5_45]|uniref:carbohydrate kinase family protein n=1 Tax=Microbacterium sp. ZW T5_45 TaxID=3378080 RepID=UPI003852C7AF
MAGHVCVDLAPGLHREPPREPGGLFDVGALTVTVGGCVGNTSLALAGFGIDVDVQAVVGADALGAIVRDELAAAGIRSSRLRSMDVGTSYSVVIEPPGQDRTFWHHTGANDVFDGTEVDLTGLDLLHVGYPMLLPSLVVDDGEPLRRLLARAKDAGVTTSLDLAVLDADGPTGAVDWTAVFARISPFLDILSPSFDDLVSTTRGPSEWSVARERGFAESLMNAGVGVVAISAGARGMSVRTADAARLRDAGRALAPQAEVWADQLFRHEVDEIIEPVSTNGAGDASTAGFLAAVLGGGEPREAATWAAAASRAVLEGRRPQLADFTAGIV